MRSRRTAGIPDRWEIFPCPPVRQSEWKKDIVELEYFYFNCTLETHLQLFWRHTERIAFAKFTRHIDFWFSDSVDVMLYLFTHKSTLFNTHSEPAESYNVHVLPDITAKPTKRKHIKGLFDTVLQVKQPFLTIAIPCLVLVKNSKCLICQPAAKCCPLPLIIPFSLSACACTSFMLACIMLLARLKQHN